MASASSGVLCSQTIEGEIRDKISNKLLEGAEVVLLDKDGALVATQTVTEDAKFSFKISCETSYLLEGKIQCTVGSILHAMSMCFLQSLRVSTLVLKM